MSKPSPVRERRTRPAFFVPSAIRQSAARRRAAFEASGGFRAWPAGPARALRRYPGRRVELVRGFRSEARLNGWTVGELHILDRRIVPNARRDNFEVNHHYYNLLVQLGPLAAKITQHCRSASVLRTVAQNGTRPT